MITCKKCGENKPPNGFYPRNKVCKEWVMLPTY